MKRPAAPLTASSGRWIRRGALIAAFLAALGGGWIAFGGSIPSLLRPALVHHELAQVWAHMVLLRQEVIWT